jgi:hypothetical protein
LFVSVAQGAELVGTDLLDEAFAAGLRNAAGQDVADFPGTLPARRAFMEGRAAAAILMVRPGEAPPVPGAREFRLASAVAVVATHGSNRMEQITFEQLVNAFGRDARAPARNWNDLDPLLRSELMTPAVSSPPGTMVLEVFQGLVLEGQAFRSRRPTPRGAVPRLRPARFARRYDRPPAPPSCGPWTGVARRGRPTRKAGHRLWS